MRQLLAPSWANVNTLEEASFSSLPLPPEIFLEVIEYLEAEDILALAQADEGFAQFAFSGHSSSLCEYGRTTLIRAVTSGHINIVRHYLREDPIHALLIMRERRHCTWPLVSVTVTWRLY